MERRWCSDELEEWRCRIGSILPINIMLSIDRLRLMGGGAESGEVVGERMAVLGQELAVGLEKSVSLFEDMLNDVDGLDEGLEEG